MDAHSNTAGEDYVLNTLFCLPENGSQGVRAHVD